MKGSDILSAVWASHQAYSGNPNPAIALAYDKLTTPKPKKPGMAPRRNKRPRKMKRRLRRTPGALKSSRLNIRHIVLYQNTSGSAHRWYYAITKSWLCSTFLSTFDEFKVISIRVKYIPNNATNETGLYASVLLDRSGFGGWGAATAIQWFPTLGAMPGCRIRSRFTPCTHFWRPTEPTVRDWFNHDQDTTYCTMYVCNNGKETDELGGLFEVSATFLARGIYKNAKVNLLREHLNSVPSRPQSPCMSLSSPASSTRSGTSVVGGFITLKME